MSEVEEFEAVVDHIYGVYLDATIGFQKAREWHIRGQHELLNTLMKSHPELANIKYLDSQNFVYGKGKPSDTDSVVLHKCTQKEFKDRNDEGGTNFKFIGNMALVSLYQYWENYYREKIAEQLELDKNDLKAPIMGDIRLIRHSVIHHSGIALKDIEKCEVLTWYKEGDSIFIDKGKFEEIILHVKKLINEWTNNKA